MPSVPAKRTLEPTTTTRRSMVANSRQESRLEIDLRSALHREGLRFRKHLEVPPRSRCRPDVVFTRARVAVFVDGCFWHRCPDHGTEPKRNGDWWQLKLDANVARDRRHDFTLREAGWTVLRFWEHQTVDEMVEEIERTVRNGAQS